MNQISPPQNKDTTPNQPGDLWSFLKNAFSFFGEVLKVLQKEPLLATFWGLGILFLVITIVALVLATDMSPLAKAVLVMLIVIILAGLFIYAASRIYPRRAYPKLDALKEIVSLRQQLEDLIHLELYLQDVQTAFEPCAEAVERADGSWLKLQVNELKHNWRSVQNQALALQAFVQGHPALDVQTWFPQVEKYSAGIDASLAKGALEPLMTDVLAYKDYLSQAETHVRQQLNQVLTDLRAFFNQISGPLDQKARLAS
jgi:hypothetical protein